MSIIYDAIQKVEKQKNGNVNKDNNSFKKKRPYGKIIILFIVFIAVAAFYLNQNGFSFIADNKVKSLINRVGIKMAEGKDDTAISVKKIQAPKGSYVLDGIIYDLKDPIAVINGKILRKNEVIDNLEIVDIAQDSATLLNKSTKETIILRLK